MTGAFIIQDDIVQCHRLKKETHVIVTLKEQQKGYNITVNRSELKGKMRTSKELVLRMQYLLMKV